MIWTAKKDLESNSGLTETFGGLERCGFLAVAPCVGSRVSMRTSREGETDGVGSALDALLNGRMWVFLLVCRKSMFQMGGCMGAPTLLGRDRTVCYVKVNVLKVGS